MYNNSLEVGSPPTHDRSHGSLRKIKFIIGTLIFFGLFVCLGGFLYKKMYRWNHPIEFKITDASITQFNLTNNNTILYYNFKITITAINFDSNVHSFKTTIKAISSYKGNQLPWVTMEPVVIGSKNTITLQPIVFEGNSTIKLKPQQIVEYNKETQLEIYNLDLELSQYYHRNDMHCRSLRIPLISNDKSVTTFNATTCWYNSFD
jgi:hypothetical protein